MSHDIEHTADDQLAATVQQLIDAKTKPIGALGRLEVLAMQLALIQKDSEIRLEKPAMLLLAGDHGLVAEGVSPYPQEVTSQMMANFIAGGAAINVFARQHRLALTLVDCGIATALDHPSVKDCRLGAGTSNCLHGPAMTDEQLTDAIRQGGLLAEKLHHDGTTIFGLGEMGIGNSSSAALLTACLLNQDVDEVTGPGTGCDAVQLARKKQVLNAVMNRHGSISDPMAAMQTVGGFELATALGAILKACELRKIILIDGFIMSAAALCAAKIHPASRDYMVFCHRSASPGHRFILEALQVEPLVDLGMRLGEGSGVAVAYPIVVSASLFLKEMASFASAQVSEKTP